MLNRSFILPYPIRRAKLIQIHTHFPLQSGVTYENADALEQEGGKEVIIDGVDRYRVIEPMVEGVRIILSHRGERYSPAYQQRKIRGFERDCSSR